MEKGYCVPSQRIDMKLNEWSVEKKKSIFEALASRHDPPIGEFDRALLKECFAKGHAQMGATVYEPHAICFEFIFPDPLSTSTVLSVRVESPERIVFLPVPPWVIESIWQGDVDGSYHFESEAKALLDEYIVELAPESNAKWFGPRPAKRRE